MEGLSSVASVSIPHNFTLHVHFLQAQYEMEAKMTELLAKISALQSGGVKAPEKDTDRIQALEKQLADVTEKRIEYMERLQEQQMAMQVQNFHGHIR